MRSTVVKVDPCRRCLTDATKKMRDYAAEIAVAGTGSDPENDRRGGASPREGEEAVSTNANRSTTGEPVVSPAPTSGGSLPCAATVLWHKLAIAVALREKARSK